MERESLVTKRQLLKLIVGRSALAVGLTDGINNSVTKSQLYTKTRQELAREQENFQRDNNGRPLQQPTAQNTNIRVQAEQVDERYHKNLFSNDAPDSLTRTLGDHLLELGGAGLTLPTLNEIAKTAIATDTEK